MTYTVNFCPNPNFNEGGLTGYTALANTGIRLDPVSYNGPTSMIVETDGLVAGEGFISASGTVTATTTGSIQFQILGTTGNLLVSVFASPSSVSPLAAVPITLNNEYVWQPVVINGIGLTNGQTLFFTVTTITPQEVMFWVDAVQFELDSPAHAYIDGDMAYCTWSGDPGNSTSSQTYQFPTGSAGIMTLAGKIVVPVVVGKQFTTSEALAGSMLMNSNPTYATTTVGNPVGAFDDFSFFTLPDVDPIQGYVSWNNAGTSSGNAAYTQIYGMFSAPSYHSSSNNGTLWNAAQYMSAGWQFTNLGASTVAEITQLQAEIKPYTIGGTPTPSTYDLPRTIHTIVKPTRLNYCPNPSGAVNTSSYVLLGSASNLVRNTSVSSAAVSGALDTCCIQCQVNTDSTTSLDGMGISISNLIVGDNYTVSAWVMTSSPGLFDVTVSCSGVNTSSFQQGSQYNSGGYGSGPYGGINTATDMTTGTWYNPSFTFTAQYSTVQLLFQPVIDTATFSTSAQLYVDAVLVEAGDVVGPYFDGGFSPSTDYMWESGGTAGATRSYYYSRSVVSGGPFSWGGGAVTKVLNDATPLGITAANPVYAKPYTQ